MGDVDKMKPVPTGDPNVIRLKRGVAFNNEFVTILKQMMEYKRYTNFKPTRFLIDFSGKFTAMSIETEKMHTELASDMCNKDDDGKPKLVEVEGKTSYEFEDKDAWDMAYMLLMEDVVDLGMKKMKYAWVSNMGLSPIEVMALEPILEIPE